MARITLSKVRPGTKRHSGMKCVIDNRELPYEAILAELDKLGLGGSSAHWYKWVQANCAMEGEGDTDIVPLVAVTRAVKPKDAATTEPAADPTNEDASQALSESLEAQLAIADDIEKSMVQQPAA